MKQILFIVGVALSLLLLASNVSAFDPSSYYSTLSNTVTWSEAQSYCSSKHMTLCEADQICPSSGVPAGGVRAKGTHWAPIGGEGVNQWIGIGSENQCVRKSHPAWNNQKKKSKSFVACCAHTGIIPAVLSKWEGFLIKGAKPTVYMVESGQKRKIPDPATFEANGFSWGRIIILSSSELDSIPNGESLSHLGTGKNSVNYKHPVLGYAHEGGHSWDELEGYLIKGKGPQVYMMELFEKRLIPDANTFEAMGFEWDLIKSLPDTYINEIPNGNTFATLEGLRNSQPYEHPIFQGQHFGRKPGPKVVPVRTFIRSIYRRLAERDPTENELQNFDKAVREGVSVPAILRQIVFSPEWLSRFHYPVIVDSLVGQYYERQADASTRLLHVEKLSNLGVDTNLREYSENNFALSDEHMNKFLKPNIRNGVAYLFRHILGRQPDAEGWVAAQKVAIKEGWEPVVRQLYDSPEYLSRNHNYGIPGADHTSTYDAIIKRLYRKLLNREAENAAVDGWKQVMNSMGLKAVVNGILESREYHTTNGPRAWYDEHDIPMEPAV